jgi:hypothetical protein
MAPKKHIRTHQVDDRPARLSSPIFWDLGYRLVPPLTETHFTRHRWHPKMAVTY